MPASDDLFGPAETPPEPAAGRPLADRLRPAALHQVVGQDHLLGPDGTLTRMLQRGSLASLILWGPPGVGKTTIARLLAARSGLHFTQLSAVFSGVADLKRTFEEATRRRTGQGTAIRRRGFDRLRPPGQWHDIAAARCAPRTPQSGSQTEGGACLSPAVEAA